MPGCQLLGDYFTQIYGEYEKANKVFKDNCDIRNYGRSCSSYGLHLIYGKGLERNCPLALEYFAKACENNDATGCDYAGKLLTNCEPSLSKHFNLDPKRGISYLERGCNLESTAQMFESSESCYAAAFLYSVGLKGVAKDENKAIQMGTKSCDMGQFRGCKLVSQIYAKMGDEKASKIFEKRYNDMEKQLKESVNIEMQRT